MSWFEERGNIIREVCEKVYFFYWDLPNYFALTSKEIPCVVSSPYFNYYNDSFQLALLQEKRYNTEGIAFFLWKRSPPSSAIQDHYYCHHFVSLGLENYEKRHYGFRDTVSKYCEGYLDYYGRFGIWNFLSLDILENNNKILSPNGMLRFICIIHRIERVTIPAPNEISNVDWKCKGCNTDNSVLNTTCTNCWFPKTFVFTIPDTSTTSDNSKIDAETVLCEEETCENNALELKGVDRLVENFKSLLLDEQSSDVLLKIEDREFKAHRVILKARSPVFASMFQPNTKESTTGVVDIPDCTALAFEVFLLYIYTGNADSIVSDNVLDLYYAADKYEINDLKWKCVEFMEENLSVDNFCEVMTLCLQHSETGLKKKATQFFCDNVKAIIKTVQWQKYLKQYSTYANELIIKAFNA